MKGRVPVPATGNGRRILVHTCCAPCCAPCGERLMLDDYEVVLYFSNWNIYPRAEYEKRLADARRLATIWKVLIEEDIWDHATWLARVRGYEDEPEKGGRCRICFAHSLERTAQLAERLGIDAFTTTLTLGPHKVSRMIFAEGERYSAFIPFDFKKKDGFRRSLQLSTEYDLYRQDYCGCEFSLAERDRRRAVKGEEK